MKTARSISEDFFNVNLKEISAKSKKEIDFNSSTESYGIIFWLEATLEQRPQLVGQKIVFD